MNWYKISIINDRSLDSWYRMQYWLVKEGIITRRGLPIATSDTGNDNECYILLKMQPETAITIALMFNYNVTKVVHVPWYTKLYSWC